MKKIFFSYCWNDDEKYKIIKFVEKLINQLEYSHDDYFLDIKNNNLGDRYWENIYKWIDCAQLFVFFNSNNYCNSGPCCKEYLRALEQEKNNNLKIIEIKLEDNTKLYSPYNDRVYVRYDDEEIINKFGSTIFHKNFNEFEISDIYYDLNEIHNSDGTITIKFKLLNIEHVRLLYLINKKEDESIDDIFCFINGIISVKESTKLINLPEEYNQKFNFSIIQNFLWPIQNKEDIKSLKYIMLAGEPLPKKLK